MKGRRYRRVVVTALVDYARGVSIDHALLYGGTTALTDQVATGIARLTK